MPDHTWYSYYPDMDALRDPSSDLLPAFIPSSTLTQMTLRKKCMHMRDVSACDVDFVPFSLEAGGVWGPAATKFFRECMAVAGGDRDIDLYHWSTPRFSSVWQDILSMLVAKGRRALAYPHLRRTGLSAFVTCSTSITTTLRWPTRGRRS